MRILFLTDNFPPEVNAPATRTHEHCKEWVKEGIDVTVITCAPNFPRGKVFEGYRNKLIQREVVDGIKVVRVWTYISENKGFLKRIIDYLSFMIASFIAGLFIKTDLIVATSPQFFTAVSGKWLSFWKRKKWIMEVRDLWPESIKAVGAMKTGNIIAFFELLEKRMYKNAHKIVVVTDSFKETLINKHHLKSTKVEVIKNGANSDLFYTIKKDEELLKELGLKNKIIVGYIGTHGMAHGLDFIFKCAKKVSDDKIHFLFLGDGAKRAELLKLKETLQLNNVTMLPSVKKEDVVRHISILDIALVNLKKSDTFKHVLPSKIFELCAMEKPILLGVEGEAKELIEKYDVGMAFLPEDEVNFLDKLEKIKNKSFKAADFERLKNDFDRKNLAKQMLSFIQAL